MSNITHNAISELDAAVAVLRNNFTALHSKISSQVSAPSTAVTAVSVQLAALQEGVSTLHKTATDPITAIDQELASLKQMANSVNSLFSAVGTAPDALYTALPAIAGALATLEQQLAARISTLVPVLENAAIDSQVVNTFTGVAADVQKVCAAGYELATHELATTVRSSAGAMRAAFSGNGSALKSTLVSSMQSITGSVQQLCQNIPNLTLPPALDLPVEILSAVIDLVPAVVFDALASVVSPAQLQDLSTRLSSLATLSHSAAPRSSTGLGADGPDPLATGGIIIVGLCNLAISALDWLSGAIPVSVYIEFGGNVGAIGTASAGWAAGLVAGLGAGVGAELGYSFGLSVINLMALLTTPLSILLSVAAMVAEAVVAYVALFSKS
jgi:hypothetical protein